ncbi:hypothetical protein GQ44DRAFT_718526 [Phaeosphaeriaceae sp. PMI808]|nr:hypothetical protein GQ44DRAFT_718526 [Phaeosphaeriaceae sp. PMI808]
MSRSPLLPSYDSASQHVRLQSENFWARLRAESRSQTALDVLCVILFPTTAITATVWATRSGTTAPKIPLDSTPMLPYFASLFLVLSFSFWVGYLIIITNNELHVPRLQRQILVRGSVSGKLILAGVHGLVWVGYRGSFAEWRQPNWLVVFLAAQAWWDVFLLLIYQYIVF